VSIDKKEYLLTVRVRFEDIDDFEARAYAKDALVKMGVSVDDAKLQRLRKDGAPEGVKL
jgi:hypothetical protein